MRAEETPTYQPTHIRFFVLICLPMAVLPPCCGDGVFGTTPSYGAASNPITRRLKPPWHWCLEWRID
jgi:hypothetical protein